MGKSYDEDGADMETTQEMRHEGGGKIKRRSTTSLASAVAKDDKVCRVCGDKALGCNFDAISCESCKAFFRRNALSEKVSFLGHDVVVICVLIFCWTYVG